MDDTPKDVIIIEGEVMPEETYMPDPPTADQVEKTEMQRRMEILRRKKPDPRASTKGGSKVNVSKIMETYGYCPVVTMILIATNNYKALGQPKPCSVHEINSAAQWLGDMSAPKFKPVDFVDPDATVAEGYQPIILKMMMGTRKGVGSGFNSQADRNIPRSN